MAFGSFDPAYGNHTRKATTLGDAFQCLIDLGRIGALLHQLLRVPSTTMAFAAFAERRHGRPKTKLAAK
ncbi:MAG: hypothetical protein B7X31_11545 [Thiomonas sp. 13-66-29]|nr:MAG: hypothetical protein B7X46_00780 [Thiomonas sp. 15-66-11]OZB60602.1 MAG: hypothetical protein B7X31_11545 [Thiomonas sp. 13-66-29]